MATGGELDGSGGTVAAAPLVAAAGGLDNLRTMVDPRIYRACLALVVLAVIVFGFSLQSPAGPDTTTLTPPPASGTTAFGTLNLLDKSYPDRVPGSLPDRKLAGVVAVGLKSAGFTVTTSSFEAQTAAGSRRLETVTGSRNGLINGEIAIVSDRDDSTAPGPVSLSGTAVLLQLARDLAGETENHSVALISTSGSIGDAGAIRLAQSLSTRPVDAVIVLGDLVAAHPSQPIVVPWSGTDRLAPPSLGATLAKYVAAQTDLPTGATSFGGQIAHLALPFTLGEQAPFAGHGIPAVLLSLSGVRTPSRHEPLSASGIDGIEAALLQTVDALDAAPAVGRPSSYLLLSGKLVPLWAIRLLVLALILPAVGATVDAMARTRRRGHSMQRWLAWVLAGGVPFLVGLLLARLIGVAGVLPATPRGPVGAGGVGLGAAGIVAMLAVLVVLLVSFAFLRPLCIRLATRLGETRRAPATPAGDAAAVALSVVMCVVALVTWVLNPFAAGLLVPALNLWLWLAQPRVRDRRIAFSALVVIGVLPGALVIFYYAHSLGLSPIDVAWSAMLLVAGGGVGLGYGLLWCVLLGCVASAAVMALRAAHSVQQASDEPGVTVRGPVTYAGPGSLGGTKSALRRP